MPGSSEAVGDTRDAMDLALVLAPIELEQHIPYRPGPSPAPYVALLVVGFVVGIFGHLIRSRVTIVLGIAMIFLATVLLPLQHADLFR